MVRVRYFEARNGDGVIREIKQLLRDPSRHVQDAGTAMLASLLQLHRHGYIFGSCPTYRTSVLTPPATFRVLDAGARKLALSVLAPRLATSPPSEVRILMVADRLMDPMAFSNYAATRHDSMPP